MKNPAIGRWVSSKGKPGAIVDFVSEGEEGFFLVTGRIDGDPIEFEFDNDEWAAFVTENSLKQVPLSSM